MAVLERDELINRITEVLDSGNEEHISLLEDVSDTLDSFSVTAVDMDYESDDNPYKTKYDEMKRRYFERFKNKKTAEEDDTTIVLDDKVSFDDVLKEGV